MPGGNGRRTSKARAHKGGEKLGAALAGRRGKDSASMKAMSQAKQAGLGGAAQVVARNALLQNLRAATSQ